MEAEAGRIRLPVDIRQVALDEGIWFDSIGSSAPENFG